MRTFILCARALYIKIYQTNIATMNLINLILYLFNINTLNKNTPMHAHVDPEVLRVFEKI